MLSPNSSSYGMNSFRPNKPELSSFWSNGSMLHQDHLDITLKVDGLTPSTGELRPTTELQQAAE